MKTIRTRFAPAPTGMMHLGNIRTALLNFLCAKQQNGAFVLRIEDTDASRNFDPGAKIIQQDLAWLEIMHDEGPEVGGNYGPYFQSKRLHIYEEKRKELETANHIYKCFCTQEELDKKRARQQALKQPPRYDRACMKKTDEEIETLVKNNTPFIWRFKLDHTKTITISDLARESISFDLSNFSDFPITRQDGSFTFMFANAIDDIMMDITHVFRGEDHLSNTAGQAAIFVAFDKILPTYWHAPILCNTDGKKLSKRDFGFSLRDLKDAGYLPQAIINYLGIIGGSLVFSSAEEEIMSLEQLTTTIDFDNINTTGKITYDPTKLQWVNKQWMCKILEQELAQLCRPLLEQNFESAKDLSNEKIIQLLSIIKTEMTTLNDCAELLSFYFNTPQISMNKINACIKEENIAKIQTLITNSLANISTEKSYVDVLKQEAKNNDIPIKELFWFLRLVLMGSTKGPGIHELIAMLGVDEAKKRIEKYL